MSKGERYVVVEKPYVEAVVDFLDEGVVVTIGVEDGLLGINVKMSHGYESDFGMPLPVRQSDDATSD